MTSADPGTPEWLRGRAIRPHPDSTTQWSPFVDLAAAEQAVRDADARARREERERLASDAAIERVAIALMEVSEYTYDEKWSEIPKSRRKDWRSRARAVLSAALAEQGEPDDA